MKTLGLLLFASSLFWAQSPPNIDVKSQPAVDKLKAMAETIKKCPEVLHYESKDKKGSMAGARIYHGPVVNVVWDVTKSKTVRSPYEGYIEFHVPQRFWVPDDVRKKYGGDKAPTWYVEMVNKRWPVLQYRYEFDVGPEGLKPTKSLSRNSDQKDWEDYVSGESCWDEAALAETKRK